MTDARLFRYIQDRLLEALADLPAGWRPEPVRLSHYRDRDGVEVDIVLESGRRMAGVEVKATGTVTQKDLRGLRSLRKAAGDAWAGGALVYDGEACVPFGDRLWAVPVASLWEPH